MQFLPLLLFLIGASASALTPRACLGRPGSYIPGELQLYGSADTSGPYNYYLSAGYTTPCGMSPRPFPPNLLPIDFPSSSTHKTKTKPPQPSSPPASNPTPPPYS